MSNSKIEFQKMRVEQSQDSNADFATFHIDKEIFSRTAESTGYMGHGKQPPSQHFMTSEAFQKIKKYMADKGLTSAPPASQADNGDSPKRAHDMRRYDGFSLQMSPENLSYKVTTENTSPAEKEMYKKMQSLYEFLSSFPINEKLKAKVWTPEERANWQQIEDFGHSKEAKPQSILQFDFYRSVKGNTRFRFYQSGSVIHTETVGSQYERQKFANVPDEITQTLVPLFVKSQLYQDGDHWDVLSPKNAANSEQTEFHLDISYGPPWKNRIQYKYTYYPNTEANESNAEKLQRKTSFETLEKDLTAWLKKPELQKYKSQ